MPTSILIDRQGRIVYRKEGFEPGDEKELERRLAALLTTPTPRDSATAFHSGQEKPPRACSTTLRCPAPFSAGGLRQGSRSLPRSQRMAGRLVRLPPGQRSAELQVRFRDYEFCARCPLRENLIRNPTDRGSAKLRYESDHADFRAGNYYGTSTAA